MKLAPMGVITPFLQKSLIQFNNTSELLVQAKNMCLINCHKFSELNTALPNIRAEQSVCSVCADPIIGFKSCSLSETR